MNFRFRRTALFDISTVLLSLPQEPPSRMSEISRNCRELWIAEETNPPANLSGLSGNLWSRISS